MIRSAIFFRIPHGGGVRMPFLPVSRTPGLAPPPLAAQSLAWARVETIAGGPNPLRRAVFRAAQQASVCHGSPRGGIPQTSSEIFPDRGEPVHIARTGIMAGNKGKRREACRGGESPCRDGGLHDVLRAAVP